jgi:predicted O-methyltransferase YrrM
LEAAVANNSGIGWWSRIVTGDGLRNSRFHTYSGRCVDAAGMAYLPSAVWSTCLLKLFGYRQRRPWLGYRAVCYLDRLIQRDWDILEFGSGMSSLFFAQRCRHLVSVESDPDWFAQMQKEFERRSVRNVDYRFRAAADYVKHPDLPAGTFDLVIVDGLVRDQAAVVAVEKVKPGGYVFFDNSDVPWPEFQAARQTLTKAAEAGGVRLFDDFCPFQVQVNESMLVRVPSEGRAGQAEALAVSEASSSPQR